jgi:hypothetical protein
LFARQDVLQLLAAALTSLAIDSNCFQHLASHAVRLLGIAAPAPADTIDDMAKHANAIAFLFMLLLLFYINMAYRAKKPGSSKNHSKK